MKRRIIGVALLLLLVLAYVGSASAEVDDYAIAKIQSEIDNAYNEKIQNGDFKSYLINGLGMEPDPFLANYYVGDFEDHLIRPMFFGVAHLYTDIEVNPADINFLALYVEGMLKDTMERNGEEYLNMPMLQEYWERAGIKNAYPQLVATSQVYAMNRDMVDVVIFGMNDFIASSMDIEEKYINNELYAMIRMCMKGEKNLTDVCYIITDQEKVYDLICAMDVQEEINEAARECLKYMN